MSCGKCVFGAYFFRYHKSTTGLARTLLVRQKQWKVVYLLKLYCHSIVGQHLMHCDSQYAWQKTKSRFSYGLHFYCITMEQTSVSETFLSMLAPYACFQLGPLCLNLKYSLVLTLCEPFSLFHQIIDSLFLCDNVLHKLEILYSSLTRLCFKRNPAKFREKIWRHYAFKPSVAYAADHSLAVVLSLLIAPNFITRRYSLIRFCIRIHVNIVQTLACLTVAFGRQGFAEHHSGG